MSHYEVKISATAVVYVADATDEAQAREYARDVLEVSDMDLTYETELLKTKQEQEASRRHADAESAP